MVCKVTYCKNSALSRGKYVGYCRTHEKQIRVYGHIRMDIVRNSKEMNEVIVLGNIARIKLYNRLGEVSGEAIIDAEDASKVRGYKWTNDGKGHVLNLKHKIWLHHLIMGFDKDSGKISDHRDGNGFDNRKENLREVTFSENTWNSKVCKRNKSGIKGVCWCRFRNMWRVVISYLGKYKHIGYYSDFDEAVKARQEASLEYHKGFDRCFS